MKQSTLQETAREQLERLRAAAPGQPRDALATLPDLRAHALIVSGIRRCGKSTLLHQLIKRRARASAFYLNFDDLRLYDFQVPDFQLLDNVIQAAKAKELYFDEIQIVPKWELYVRQKLDQGYKVAITGSNASLLSRELGTKLTGRHVTRELFPFSYNEFNAFCKLKPGENSFDKYMRTGGFPEVVKTGNLELLNFLAEDILNRDIIVRHGIKDAASLKRLLSCLLSNAARLTTPSKLKETIGVKSPATILDYFSYLEAGYLIHMVPRFSFSIKSQMLAPKKMYISDSGLIKAGSVSFSADSGRVLENIIYCELRRRGRELFYYEDNGKECDLVEMRKGKAVQILQVCWEMTPDNEGREVTGLLAAMDFFKCETGLIITRNQRDTIRQGAHTINLLPAHEYLTQQPPAPTAGVWRPREFQK